MHNKFGLTLLEKKAFPTISRNVANDILLGAAGITAGTLGVKAADAATDAIRDMYDRHKYSETINYAQKKHPELKRVPKEQLVGWMDAFHTLSPRLAKNKELASSMLVTTHNYGNNIDLATAKLIADAGEKSNRQHMDANGLMQVVGVGSSLANATISTARGLSQLEGGGNRAGGRTGGGNGSGRRN